MNPKNSSQYKRLQRRLNYLEIRSPLGSNEDHKKWLSWNFERTRLKNIINYHSKNEKELKIEYYNYDNYKVKMIAKALLMYLENNSIHTIIEKTKLSKSSIYNYIDCYKTNKNFMNSMYKKPKQTISELEKFQYIIADDFEKTCIRTYKEAQERIHEITKIKISIPNIFNFLVNHNFEKNNGCYTQIQTKEIQKQRLLYEKVFLTDKKEEVKKYILSNNLEYNYRLIAKLRDRFNIKYIPRSWLKRYLSENGII